jgi:hypothetical protein
LLKKESFNWFFFLIFFPCHGSLSSWSAYWSINRPLLKTPNPNIYNNIEKEISPKSSHRKISRSSFYRIREGQNAVKRSFNRIFFFKMTSVGSTQRLKNLSHVSNRTVS